MTTFERLVFILAIPFASWFLGLIALLVSGAGNDALMTFAGCVVILSPVFYAVMACLRVTTQKPLLFRVVGGVIGLVLGSWLAYSLHDFNLEHDVTHTLDGWLTSASGRVGAVTGLIAGLTFGQGFALVFCGDGPGSGA